MRVQLLSSFQALIMQVKVWHLKPWIFEIVKMSMLISFFWNRHWAWTLFYWSTKGISVFTCSPPDQRSSSRWIQVISSSLSYNICNIRCLRMWHSDTERPVGTIRNVIRSRGSIAFSSSSPPLPPFSSLPPQRWLCSCVSTRQLCQVPWLKPQTNLKGPEPISDTFWENAQKLFLDRVL